MTLVCLTGLMSYETPRKPQEPYKSNVVFQTGLSVFFCALQLAVWSPSTVTTAKGSGKPTPQV